MEKQEKYARLITGVEIRAFSGFYGTIWEGSSYLSEIKDHHDDEPGWDEVNSWDDIEFDQKEYEKDLLGDIVPKFCKAFNEIFGGNIEFSGGEIESPREYNFRNDELYVDFNIKDYDAFVANVEKYVELYRDEIREKVRRDWSDRDGFWSFVENDFDKWNWEEDTQQMEILLDYIIQLDRDSRGQLERLELDIWEDTYVRPEYYWKIIYPNVSEK